MNIVMFIIIRFIYPTRQSKAKHVINYIGIKIHNKLPQQIKTLNQRHFKMKLKNVLVRSELQNFDEFITFVYS